MTSLVFSPAAFAEGNTLEPTDAQKEMKKQQIITSLQNNDFKPAAEQQKSFSALAISSAVYSGKVDFYHTHVYNFDSAGGEFTLTDHASSEIDLYIFNNATGEDVQPVSDKSFNIPAGNYSMLVTSYDVSMSNYSFELKGNFVSGPDTTLPALTMTSPNASELRLPKGSSTTFAVKGTTDAESIGIEKNSTIYDPIEGPGTFSKSITLDKGLNAIQVSAFEATGNAVFSDHYVTLPGVARIAGKDRYAVSAGVSKEFNKFFNTGTIVISRGDLYPDALSGGPLAAMEGAPVLLTATKGLPTDIKNQVSRLGAERAIILGGTGSVSTTVESQLRSLGVTSIERIGGKDRFVVSADTAKRVAANSGSDTAIIASGMVFPDALSASTIAGPTGMPILLVKDKTIPDAIQAFIKNHPNIKNYIVVGGPATVNDSVITKIKQLRSGAYVERIGGKDRYEVGINVAKFGVKNLGFGLDTLTVVRGDIFPDALSGAPLANFHEGPILLTTSAKLEAKVNTFLQNNQSAIDNIYIVGGTGSVSTTTEQQLNGHIK